MEPHDPLPVAVHKIARVRAHSDAVVVVFDNGREHTYPADLLYAFVPHEFDLAEQLRRLRVEGMSDEMAIELKAANERLLRRL